MQRFELVDCRDNPVKKLYHQPTSTLIQFARSMAQCFRLEVSECESMETIMLIASLCAHSCFNLQIRLRIPPRVVKLDQDSEFFKDILEKAKENKEASRMIANLTTPNPTADSRRALFMLRNALQTTDKCSKLADALVIQPCEIEFSSEAEIQFGGKHALEEFLETSEFLNGVRVKSRCNDGEPLNRRRRERRQLKKSNNSRQPTATTSGSTADGGGDHRPSEKQEKLFKMINSIMGWISKYPGIELESLKTNLAPLFGVDCIDSHLSELLELMETLELISRDSTPLPPYMCRKPLLFGYRELTEEEQEPIITFAPRENAYVKLSQLIDVEL